MILNQMLICLVGALFTFIPVQAANHHPILIVPGITGSQLYVNDSNEGICDTEGKFHGLWVSEARLAEDLLDKCASKELMLVYNNATGSYSNTPNVDIRVQNQSVTYLEYLDTNDIFKIPYFIDFTDFFVSKYSYVRDKDLRGAAYDWRLAPDELQKRGYYEQVRQQVESMYEESGGTKVALVVHSMGGPVTLYFLNKTVTQAWKDKYLHAFITLSGAWAGSPKTLQEQISGGAVIGEKFGRKLQELIRSIARTLQSVYWLFPNPDVFKGVLVRTPNKTYTSGDFMALLTDIGLPLGYKMYEETVNLIKGFPAPGVDTYCYWGVDTDTPISFNYSENFPQGINNNPSAIGPSDGDGTVNAIASQVCRQWTKNLRRNMTFPKVKHVDMVKNTSVLETIAEVVAPSLSGGPRAHPKPSDDKHMEGLFDPMKSRTLMRAYQNFQKTIGKMLKMARINNYYN